MAITENQMHITENPTHISISGIYVGITGESNWCSGNTNYATGYQNIAMPRVHLMDPSKCEHKMYSSYAFNEMRVPTCMDCNKPMDGEAAKNCLKEYQKIIDDSNARAEKDFKDNGRAGFYVKKSDGSYKKELRHKNPSGSGSVFGIIKDAIRNFYIQKYTKKYNTVGPKNMWDK